MRHDLYISVDIEADGPMPGPYSMVSLGAVVVGEHTKTGPGDGFYRELKPISQQWSSDALAVSGLSREHLCTHGADPERAMTAFADWIDERTQTSEGVRHSRPVFVAFNASFDWMFVHWYFMRYLERNPFGISGLDIKAYLMGGLKLNQWTDTTKRSLAKTNRWVLSPFSHTHNALDDAREQADMFARAQAVIRADVS